MSDLIDRQAAIDAVKQPHGGCYTEEAKRFAVYQLLSVPTAEPEIVKCKECLMHGVCRFEQGLGLDGYCSQAERRTDGRVDQQTGGD